MTEKTFAMIKPHAVKELLTGTVLTAIERNKFTVLRMEKRQLARKDAESFYAVHKERPFFNELVENMIAGPVILLALEKENAIQQWRDLMGATNPAQAHVGTLRYTLANSISYNVVHGSDSKETAKTELGFFFTDLH